MLKNVNLLIELLLYIRNNTNSLIFVKLSPDMENEEILKFANIIKQFDKIGLNLGNTSHKECKEVGLPDNAIKLGEGGLSGPGLYERTLEMTKLVSPIGIPIIATGGVDSSFKVKELLANGASLVGIASAVAVDMYSIPIINFELSNRKRC